jgi:lipoprotein NlpI
MNRSMLFLFVGSLVLGASQSVAQESATPRAATALRAGDREGAIKAAEAMLNNRPDDPSTMMMAADVYLRCNKPDLAVPLYDRYIEANPQSMPQLWQRGIALYFIGKHAEAAEQFVEHRRVNPHDVENAAWHYLCLAKAESIDKANESVLPAPNDPRIPMAEVQQMLLKRDPSLVSDRMSKVPTESRQYASAMFYGNFYLGLYADANGDQKTALDKMTQSAKDAPRHYMGDISRVYAEFLRTADSAKAP